MINLTTKQEVTTKREYRIEVTGKDLIELIAQGTTHKKIPLNARVEVMVPGGGDWSSCELDINDHPIIIQWEEVERA